MTTTASRMTAAIGTKGCASPAFDGMDISREAIRVGAATRVQRPASAARSIRVIPSAQWHARNALIAAHSYARYLSRGEENGDAMTDWLEAAREIDGEASR